MGNKIIDSCLSEKLWERLRKNLGILKFALYWNIAFDRAGVAVHIAKWWNTTDDSILIVEITRDKKQIRSRVSNPKNRLWCNLKRNTQQLCNIKQRQCVDEGIWWSWSMRVHNCIKVHWVMAMLSHQFIQYQYFARTSPLAIIFVKQETFAPCWLIWEKKAIILAEFVVML